MGEIFKPPVLEQKAKPPVLEQKANPPVLEQKAEPPVLEQKVKPSANLPSFREIVAGFTSSGVMTVKIIEYVTEADASKIMAKQNMESSTHMKALNDQSLLTDEVVLTLVAIKILSTHYNEDKKLWSLVEKKARKFI